MNSPAAKVVSPKSLFILECFTTVRNLLLSKKNLSDKKFYFFDMNHAANSGSLLRISPWHSSTSL